MKGFLSENKINYILHHLGHSYGLTKEIKKHFIFHTNGLFPNGGGKIIFRMSDRDLSMDHIRYVENLPVLFPVSAEDGVYHMEGDHLFFHHDFLKSAFYLLSGYQEKWPGEHDPLGRYPYKNSIQHQLGITVVPLVNYYFKVIGDGIGTFCARHGIPFEQKGAFRNFSFFLTHDVDIIDTYTLYETIYRMKQLFGWAPSDASRSRMLQITGRYLRKSLNVFNRDNPHWDFDTLREVERRYGFRSAFFFLPKDRLHVDSYYAFNERRILDLLRSLDSEGCEIGIHGTVRSSVSIDALEHNLHSLKEVSPQPVLGIRQHRLMYDRNITPGLHQDAGLLYDTTLGFAEHEGFRNSYCLPFRLYDFQADAMMDIWEIPLALMDATMFQYRKIAWSEIQDAVNALLDEVQKFGGVFTLLWHNGQNNEFLYPGITEFYRQIIQFVADRDPENLLGHEIVKRFQHD